MVQSGFKNVESIKVIPKSNNLIVGYQCNKHIFV